MHTTAIFIENRPFFGALLVHVPLLHALRRERPESRLVLHAPFPQARLLVDEGAADDLLVYSGGFAQALASLRRLRPDAALVLRPASRGLDLAVAAAHVPASAGFDSWLGRRVYTRVAPHDTRVYRPRKYLSLVTDGATARRATLDEWFRPLASRAALATQSWTRTLAVLPGGGAGEFKRWGVDRFLALCGRLAADDPALRFAWVLGPQERDAVPRIAASPVADRSEILAERPLADLAAAAFAAHAAVGNDCGPGHVFQMCGCPFACVMGDHDGHGAIRAAEWIDEPSLPFTSFPATGEPIGEVGVETVLERVRAALAKRDAASPA
jgi:ADP-heptose:LPS heptosyltransferase